MNLYKESHPAAAVDPGGYLRTSRDDKSVSLQFERGTLRFRPIPGGIFRISYTADESFENLPSFAVEEEPEIPEWEFSEEESFFRISSGRTVLKVKKSGGGITYTDTDGNQSAGDIDSAFLRTEWGLRFVRELKDSAKIYGLGEKTGFLNKRGQRYQMWNTDNPTHLPDSDPLYKTIPFYISFDGERAHGFFTDRSCRSYFDFGFSSTEAEIVDIYDRECDLYYFPGPEISDVVTAFTGLTGRMELPPLWALGYQQCRWSYYPEAAVLALADKIREKAIPCDVIYLDIDYMDGFRVFTWDPERFPDPKSLLEKLKNRGFKVVTIIDPGIKRDTGFPVYLDGIKKEMFCKRSTGEVYTGQVWPGGVAFPDFTRKDVQEWWADQHRNHFENGVAGIWNDMNEPSDAAPREEAARKPNDRTINTVPGDVILENGGYTASFDRYHNAYGLCMNKATREAFRKYSGQRPFVLTRSAYAGVQKYAAVWSGDNHSWWEHIAGSMAMHMNIGLSGIPFVGGDIGGFGGNASGELFARWMQLGVFTPFCRSHSASGTRSQEPWVFGQEIEDICRKFIRLRYRLLPYIYSCFRNAAGTGLPVMRPLVMRFPDDPAVAEMDDQFLFGEAFLAAPVYRPGVRKRTVYIPGTGAYDFWTDEFIRGKSYTIADAPLEKMPLFVMPGSIIAEVPPRNYVSEQIDDDSTYIIHLYPGKKSGSFTLYEDDGESYGYTKGEYNEALLEFSMSGEGFEFSLNVTNLGYSAGRKKLQVQLHGADTEFTIEGSGPAGSYDGRRRIFRFECPIKSGTFTYRRK
ncbi:MAG: TIM-barrel domain-containing protein [Spirochaetia bacterium]